jgi:hypothetical protein
MFIKLVVRCCQVLQFTYAHGNAGTPRVLPAVSFRAGSGQYTVADSSFLSADYATARMFTAKTIRAGRPTSAKTQCGLAKCSFAIITIIDYLSIVENTHCFVNYRITKIHLCYIFVKVPSILSRCIVTFA